MRPVDLKRYVGRDKPSEPVQYVWLRATGRLPDDPAIHRAVLAYLSDMTLLDTALIAHGKSIFQRSMQVASLDHSLWFHRPFRADEWLLYAQDSPNTSGARGLTRGLIYTQDGRLVASVAQEGLIRQRVVSAARLSRQIDPFACALGDLLPSRSSERSAKLKTLGLPAAFALPSRWHAA